MSRNFQVSAHHGENKTLYFICDDELDLSTSVDDKELAKHVAHLLNMEQAEICPQCSGVSAYCWDDVSKDAYEDDSLPYNPKQGTIAHIPTGSCWEWQCGHCQAHHNKRKPLTYVDKIKREHPWIFWWEEKKLEFTEFLARWFHIYVDW